MWILQNLFQGWEAAFSTIILSTCNLSRSSYCNFESANHDFRTSWINQTLRLRINIEKSLSGIRMYTISFSVLISKELRIILQHYYYYFLPSPKLFAFSKPILATTPQIGTLLPLRLFQAVQNLTEEIQYLLLMEKLIHVCNRIGTNYNYNYYNYNYNYNKFLPEMPTKLLKQHKMILPIKE